MFLKNVPEEVISTRVASAEPQDVAVNQHTAAALARICSYLKLISISIIYASFR